MIFFDAVLLGYLLERFAEGPARNIESLQQTHEAVTKPQAGELPENSIVVYLNALCELNALREALDRAEQAGDSDIQWILDGIQTLEDQWNRIKKT
jgi:hypothetical protein